MDSLSVAGVDLAVGVRILLAAALGLTIGLEREVRGKAAGVRTHVILAAAAAALGWLSVTAAEGDQSADPTRIASYTVAGISFLGGGLIVGVHTRVHGLTTAVGAFTVTAIGLLAGMGYPAAAISLTVVTLLTLAPLDWVKARTYGRLVRREATLHVLVPGTDHLAEVRGALGEVELRALEVQPLPDGGIVVMVTVRGREESITAAAWAVDEVAGARRLGTVTV